MKNFYQVITLTMVVLSLTACSTTKTNFDGSEKDFLRGDRGGIISSCIPRNHQNSSEVEYIPLYKSDTSNFWKDYDLPKGTINFVCKDGKAYLPKDCQGNSLNRQQILSYWNRYQLPKGLVNFDCSTGTPKVPANELKFWQDLERQTPTCKGGKPCV